MKLHLRQIPAEGKHLDGETDCPIADFDSEDVKCAGPLRYSLDVGKTHDALWASGSLNQPVTLRCVACLEHFEHTIEVANFTVHIELAGPELVDLAPLMREDILLNLPPYPKCDRQGGRECPAANTIDVADDETDAQKKREAAWAALDKLKLKRK
jgi:uncharacterized protein